jgi:hypothetical protein
MVADTELYGGDVETKTEGIAKGIIKSFDNLPEDTKGTMKDTM